MRSPLLPVLGVAVLIGGLSGCAGGGGNAPGVDATSATSGGAGMGAALTKPDWAVGDAWTYDFNGDSTAYVITSQTSSDWIMETDSAERSFSDLRQDVSRLGPQRKSDLAGSQGQERVEFFRWPLEAGKTWTTTWDHLDVAIQVTDVSQDVAKLEAHLAGDGSLAYRYTYDAGQRWFGDLRHFAPDGSELVHLALKEASHDWTGTIVRWDLAVVNASQGTGAATVGGPVDIPAGTTDVWAEYHFTCTGAGGYILAIEPASPGLAAQQGFRESGPCVQVDGSRTLVEGPHPGTWAFALDVGGQTVDFDYAVLLRTRTDAKFPA
ncbi:MAG TPA: hypothetical protein VM327_04350 [Candidatus Thermoplasmatota archaeon]|nr:hypothetical protein [Candidatus Thermoplasmatota archaeon]